MVAEVYDTLCRFCLGGGAQFLIFENDIRQKLSTCLQEKVEDLEGYPQKICCDCNDKLDIACDFINMYKHSYRVLQSSIVTVKEEKLFENNYNDDDYILELTIKAEPDEIDLKPKIEQPDYENQNCLLKLKDRKELCIKSIKLKNKTKKPMKKAAIPSKPLTPKIGRKRAQAVTKKEIMSSKQQNDVKLTENEGKKSKEQLQSTTFLCDLCGKEFKSNHRLQEHRLTHFGKKFTCPQCPRVFTKIDYLNRHKRKNHDQKDLVCEKCGKQYVLGGDLKKHIAKSHGDGPKKRFACTLCDKTYTSKLALALHFRSVHTGERPEVCSVCDAAFAHKSYLREHMRLHTGETPFKCPVCGRGYAQRCNMKSHMKQHKISEVDADTLSKMKPVYLKLLKP